MNDCIETKWVYESPDGGDTVYRRQIGSLEREIYSISDRKREWDLRQARENLWHDILQASQGDPALLELLQKVEVYYSLKSQP